MKTNLDLTDIRNSILLKNAVASRVNSLRTIKEAILREGSTLIFAVGDTTQRLVLLLEAHPETELKQSFQLQQEWRDANPGGLKKSLAPGYTSPTLKQQMEYYAEEPPLANSFLAINHEFLNSMRRIDVVARPRAVNVIHSGLGVEQLITIRVPFKYRKFDQALQDLGSRVNIVHASLMTFYEGNSGLGGIELALKTLSPSLSGILRMLDAALA